VTKKEKSGLEAQDPHQVLRFHFPFWLSHFLVYLFYYVIGLAI